MHRSFVSIGLAAILVLAVPSVYNFAGAQEVDHDHAEHAAETVAAGPSINDTSLAVELVADGLTLPTAMAFLDENRSALALEGALADTPEESKSAGFGAGFGGVTDIKTGPDGYLYVASFIDGAIFRVVPVEAGEEEGTILTVESADLSNNTITGMFTTVSSNNGTVLQEGYTPLMFNGEEGFEYTVTVADFGNRAFDHWDDGSTNRTRTITLEQDTTITAYYDVDAEAEADSSNTLIEKLVRILDGDDCFDEQDERKFGKEIGKLIGDIFGENEDDRQAEKDA